MSLYHRIGIIAITLTVIALVAFAVWIESKPRPLHRPTSEPSAEESERAARALREISRLPDR